MGIMSWIKKKEIDVSNFKRRESAPPISAKHFDPNKSRDEAYVRALMKFNEWRVNERNERNSDDMDDGENNTEGERENRIEDENAADDELSNHQDELLKNSNNRLNPAKRDIPDAANNQKTLQNEEMSGSPPKRLPKKIARHSLPTNMSKSKYRPKKPEPSHEIIPETELADEDDVADAEIQEFEGAHCNAGLSDANCVENLMSPPVKFYRENSNPYPVERPVQPPPAPKIDFLSESYIRKCPKKPKRTLLKRQDTKKNTKELADAHFNGSYKNYEMKSPFFNEQMLRHTSTAASSSSMYYDGQYQYQTIKNKHGDLVEYALPACEQESFAVPPRKMNAMRNTPTSTGLRDFNEMLDSLSFSSGLFPNVCQTPKNLMNVSQVTTCDRNKKLTSDVMITDLDKSIETENRNSNMIFDDLNSLSKWSENLARMVDPKLKSINGVLVCQDSELKPKKSVLKNTFTLPLDIMSGTFRKTTVTLRKHGFDGVEDGACLPIETARVAEEAIKKDLEILSQFRHQSIIMLMALSYNTEINDVTLILEPADYTLYYYLHQMREKLSLIDTVSIVQQIASAALYLQECGYIHSNISSSCVLIQNQPNEHLVVKLSAFELTTTVSSSVQYEIESKFKRNSKALKAVHDSFYNTQNDTVFSRNGDHNRYRQLSKEISTFGISTNSNLINGIESRFLPYYVDYRRQLSLYFYRPPELLTCTERFVYPTKSSDVYSLTLLLWEILNQLVPFCIYTEDELEYNYTIRKASLPIFEEERCILFKQIFKYGLEIDPIERSMTVQHFISLLEDIKFEIHKEERGGATDRLMEMFRIEDDDQADLFEDPTKEENYYENDDFFRSTAIESPKKKVVENATYLQPQFTSPIKDKSPMNHLSNSTLQQSILDYNKFLPPKGGSTLKRRKKWATANPRDLSLNEGDEVSKVSVNDPSKNSHNNENKCCISPNGDDIIGPIVVREIELPSKRLIRKQQNQFLNQMLSASSEAISPLTETKDETKSEFVKEAESPKTIKQEEGSPKPDTLIKTTRQGPSQSEYRFKIDDYVVPNNIIARKNKIRRNAWLSANKSLVEPFEEKVEPKVAIVNKTLPNLLNNKTPEKSEHVNVSIKILHKQVTPVSKKSDSEESTVVEEEAGESPSVSSRIKFWSSLESPPCVAPLAQSSEIIATEPKKVKDIVKMAEQSSTRETTTTNKQLLHEITQITEEILSFNCFEEIIEKKNNSNLIEEMTNSIIANNVEIVRGKFEAIKERNENCELKNSLVKHKSMDATNTFETSRFEKSIWQKENEICVQSKALMRLQEAQNDKADGTFALNIKRNSVLEAVMRIEGAFSTDRANTRLKKIDNKLFYEKVNNTNQDIDEAEMKEAEEDEETGENANKWALCAPENGSLYAQSHSGADNKMNRKNSTLIKRRTVYRESIISSSSSTSTVDVAKQEQYRDAQSVPSPQTNTTANTPAVSSSAKKMTTRVTVNLRKINRRLSDVGVMQMQNRSVADVRHSIGSELVVNHVTPSRNQTVVGDGTSDRTLKRRCHSCALVAESNMNLTSFDVTQSSKDLLSSFRNKPYNEHESVEDLYIDDDYCQGLCLGANMKLVTNSMDLLDGIDFDIISTTTTEIYEEETTSHHDFAPEEYDQTENETETETETD